MGIGFTIALTLIGLVREILGAGSVLGTMVIPKEYHITAFVLAPGAFFALAVLTALQNKFKAPSATNGDTNSCGAGCGSCGEKIGG